MKKQSIIPFLQQAVNFFSEETIDQWQIELVFNLNRRRIGLKMSKNI